MFVLLSFHLVVTGIVRPVASSETIVVLNAILFNCNESMQYPYAKVGSALRMQTITSLITV